MHSTHAQMCSKTFHYAVTIQFALTISYDDDIYLPISLSFRSCWNASNKMDVIPKYFQKWFQFTHVNSFIRIYTRVITSLLAISRPHSKSLCPLMVAGAFELSGQAGLTAEPWGQTHGQWRVGKEKDQTQNSDRHNSEDLFFKDMGESRIETLLSEGDVKWCMLPKPWTLTERLKRAEETLPRIFTGNPGPCSGYVPGKQLPLEWICTIFFNKHLYLYNLGSLLIISCMTSTLKCLSTYV